MCIEKTDWEKIIDFHGHTCPGLAKGYRVSKIALKELREDRSEDEELVAIVENDSCAIDAVQFLTGCTLGKGNLIFRDYGKQVYTFICRNSGKAVRICVRGSGEKREDKEFRALLKKFSDGTASPQEKELFMEYKDKRTHLTLELPDEELCIIRHIKVEPPSRARLFESVTCAFCGEDVAEIRARLKDGKVACIPCSEEYTRGW